MSSTMQTVKEFLKPCECGREHLTTIKDVVIEKGAVRKVGEILKRNGFPDNLLVVADKSTIDASSGIIESLNGFNLQFKIYETLRVAEMKHVDEIREIISGKDISVLAIGTGSIHDPCRLASALENKPLCVFATAPSMDGFASYSSPIVKDGFKASYPAKSPEVIIGDTEILASSPVELKSAGFGDMISKYVALIDWKVSALLTSEYYCEKIASLTRSAVDELLVMAESVTSRDSKTAGKIMESLLKTGIGMSFSQNSRPASGAEHIVSHLIECVELRDNIVPNYHGEDVGVATLEVLKYYNELAKITEIDVKKDSPKWDEIYSFYGSMAEEVKKVNTPNTITDLVDLKKLKESWGEIRKIIKSVPSYEECKSAMQKAGCKITVKDIGKSEKLFSDCFKYSPYMRRRLTLLRLKDMIV